MSLHLIFFSWSIRINNRFALEEKIFRGRHFWRGISISVAGETSIVTGMAGRYATALFELAREKDQLDQVLDDLKGFVSLLDESSDLKGLVESPIYSADVQEKAISALLKNAGFSQIVENFLQVIARNNRLFAVEDIIKGYRALLSQHRGEITAEAISATALSEEQQGELRNVLKEIAGQDIELQTKVDPSLLGGLIVRLGSRQIDSSLRTKLNNMKTLMKEVS